MSAPEGLATRVARLEAENERLRKGLQEVREFLENPEWGTTRYMEGSGVYDDKDAALFNIRYALGEVS